MTGRESASYPLRRKLVLQGDNMEHTVTLAEVWICTCGVYFVSDRDARNHIHQPGYDAAQSQWRPTA